MVGELSIPLYGNLGSHQAKGQDGRDELSDQHVLYLKVGRNTNTTPQRLSYIFLLAYKFYLTLPFNTIRHSLIDQF